MDNTIILQIQIYTRKFFRTLKRESFISIIMGVIITMLVMAVTKENMFENFEGTKSGMFSLICVCIWIGIFNSIQLVCREKNDIVKDELDKSLHARAYIASHFIYQFFLCLIQSVIVFLIFIAFMAEKGADIGNPLFYLITIFLMMFASDAMAFVISSAVPNPIVAMTVMPLMLLIQLVMAGVLFELDGAADVAANFTISKWGMSALGIIGDITTLPSRLENKFAHMGELAPKPEGGWISQDDRNSFSGFTEDILVCWLIFIAFIAAFYALSVLALKYTTRKIKK